MAARSAGILMYRREHDALQFLLAHPGGPFWQRRDVGAWTIPKGEIGDNEDPETAARREFREELGVDIVQTLQPLGEIVQKAGKRVIAFALQGDFDPAQLRSNTFELEWPPRSGKRATFPEVDRVAWLDLTAARSKILPAQIPLLARLEDLLS
jgi:predicted NUDIX family NTP pyrophosphohydrolase